MDNPGVYPLAALQVTGAFDMDLISPVSNLAGMSAVTLEANLQYGSGGATLSAIVVTSFDGGTAWRHVARFDFTTASRVAIANLNGLLSKAVAAYADLASEGVNDGMLGDQLAVFLISSGTYANTTLSVRASVR